MSKFEKIKTKIKNGQSVSYAEAEIVLNRLGFSVRSKDSHHVFSKDGYCKNVSIKKCPELLRYQLDLYRNELKNWFLAASATSDFEPACIAQPIQVELLRRR